MSRAPLGHAGILVLAMLLALFVVTASAHATGGGGAQCGPEAVISASFGSGSTSASASAACANDTSNPKDISNISWVLCDGTTGKLEGITSSSASVGPFGSKIVSITVKSGTTRTTFTSGVDCTPTPPPPPVDVCPNIDGNQATVPDGMELVDGDCVTPPPPPVDVCPNIDGNQATVPEGMSLVDGSCVTTPDETPGPVDVCPNIEGIQASVPAGMQQQDGQCVTPQGPLATPDETPAPTPTNPPLTPMEPTDIPGEPTVTPIPEADTPAPVTPTAVAGEADTPDAGGIVAPPDLAATGATGELPFTGLETVWTALLGSGFLAAGATLHLRARRHQRAAA